MARVAAPAERTRKRNDTDPPFRILLQDAKGPFNLTGATDITLFMTGGSPPTIITISCTADPGQGTAPEVTGVISDDDLDLHPTGRGWIEGPIAADDLAVAGDYKAEIQVTRPVGKTTFPNKGTIDYTIEPDLDAA